MPATAAGTPASRPGRRCSPWPLVRPLTPMQLAVLAPAGDRRPGEPAGRLEARPSSRSGSRHWRTAPARWPPRSRTSSGDVQIGVAEALLFSNGKRIVQELLADGDGRLVGRLKQIAAPGRADRPGRAQRPLAAARRRGAAHCWRSTSSERTDRPDEACRQLVWALLTCPSFDSIIDR